MARRPCDSSGAAPPECTRVGAALQRGGPKRDGGLASIPPEAVLPGAGVVYPDPSLLSDDYQARVHAQRQRLDALAGCGAAGRGDTTSELRRRAVGLGCAGEQWG
jgi:hypothetical protein